MIRSSVILTLLFLCADADAQTYVYNMVQGAQSFTANLRPNARLIMAGPAEDTLTEWQDLPFAWSFFGQTVTGYYASDNGYITFNPAAQASVPDNRGAASAVEPNNAIFGFWDDLHFSAGAMQWSNEIRTITIGTEPDRAHVIVWVSAVPHGVEFSSSNNISFAIVLKESGGFEVIQIAGRFTLGPLTGSIGAENADGSLAAWVGGSPALTFPNLTASADDDISYRFRYTEMRYDLNMLVALLPASVISGTVLEPAVRLRNDGTETITSFLFNYRVNDSAVVSHRVTTTIPGNTIYYPAHPVPWTVTHPGEFQTITFWVSELNMDKEDENHSNDTLVARVFPVLGNNVERRVLIEEFTGAWCGWCPDGSLQMQDIESTHPSAALVSIHAGGTDSMIVAEGAALAAVFKPGYPMAMIDRFRFPGEAGVPISRTGGAWQRRIAERQAVPPPVELAIDGMIVGSWHELKVGVRADFKDYGYPGDLRLNVFVIEDRVTGSGRGYDQINYYSGNSSYPGHPYYSETNPILGFVHRHVLRAVLTGEWGDPNVVPPSPQADQSYSKQYSITLPPDVDIGEVSVVAFLSYADPENGHHEVVNAVRTPIDLLLGVEEDRLLPAAPEISVYPNPVYTRATLRIAFPTATRARVSVYDMLGREVIANAEREFPAGVSEIALRMHGLPAGLYLCRIVSATREYHVTVRMAR